MEQGLRRELKRWQKSFKTKHGRDPTKRDILADASIAGVYDTWQAVGGDSQQIQGKARVKKTVPVTNKSKYGDGQKPDESSVKASVLRTPTKSKRFSTQDANTSPSKNPFKTPTKTEQKPNPFATPNRSSPKKAELPSPTGSVVDVTMTPVKDAQYEDAGSPSRLRSLVAAHSKHATSPLKKEHPDAALMTYTPRTKARKRLRGEPVPPTPKTNGRVVSERSTRPDLRHAGTEPRPPLATHRQQGLGAFGFNSGPRSISASTGKLAGHRSVTAPASVFSRQQSDSTQGHAIDEASPSRPKARLSESNRREFTPLFASPSGNHAATVLPDFVPKTAMPRTSSTSSVASSGSVDQSKGGLFAAELEKRRRHVDPITDTEDGGKRQKLRQSLALPSSSDDEDAPPSIALSTSSPFTKSTAPTSSDPRRTNTILADKAPTHMQNLVVSDDEDNAAPGKVDGSKGEQKVITMLPYQRYGSLRNAHRQDSFPHSERDSEDEDGAMFDSYCLVAPKAPHLSDSISSGWGFDSELHQDGDDQESVASIAGLQLSPNKHGPSSSMSRARQQEVLETLFDPTAAGASTGSKSKSEFDPAARAGPIAPSGENAPDELDLQSHAESAGSADDDDDWEQDVDEEYTFLDNEIELGDMA